MVSLPLSRVCIALWAVAGVELILLDALHRLLPRALEPLLAPAPLSTEISFFYLFNVVFFGFFEGYRGFQKSFSPRVIARSFFLAEKPSFLNVIFAPIFVMSLYGSTKRRVAMSWVLILVIVTSILCVQQLPPAYRAAVDAGVVVGLGWGALSLAWFFWAALRQGPQVDPEVGTGAPPMPAGAATPRGDVG